MATELMRVVEICKTVKELPARWVDACYLSKDKTVSLADAIQTVKMTYDFLPTWLLSMEKVSRQLSYTS